MGLFRKNNPRRTHVRRRISADRLSWFSWLVDADVIVSLFLGVVFWGLVVAVLSFDNLGMEWGRVLPMSIFVFLAVTGMGFYIRHFQPRLISSHAGAVVMAGLFLVLLTITRIGIISAGMASWATSWATGSAIMVGMVLTIAYDQRFAIGMGGFYAVFVCLVAGPSDDPYRLTGLWLLITMVSGVLICSFSLREIRTRMKLLEVSSLTAAGVFVVACLGVHEQMAGRMGPFRNQIEMAGCHAGFSLLAGLFIHTFLPLIERLFRIATSMTLLDLSDANQPLLRKLALDASGTFSHSLLIGSIAEAAAEAIGGNGLLCRVGAYYHDVGKINKPRYFIENEMGSGSRHKELSPTMSQLIIVGHVKDGIEMAREYRLPAVIRQFVESHHGTTLVEPFFREAWRQFEAAPDGEARREAPPSESEFRYPGPKPRSREEAIVMLADAAEGAVRSLGDVSPSKVEAVVHTMAMKRLQDGQFDECDITLRELSRVEVAMAKVLAAHYHGRIAYPTPADLPPTELSLDRRDA